MYYTSSVDYLIVDVLDSIMSRIDAMGLLYDSLSWGHTNLYNTSSDNVMGAR